MISFLESVESKNQIIIIKRITVGLGIEAAPHSGVGISGLGEEYSGKPDPGANARVSASGEAPKECRTSNVEC